MLTVWGRKSSSNVQAVLWCIGELGLPCVRHDVGHSYGGNDTPEFLAMNPNGLVPVLRDGDGAPLWESGAILRYLASRYATDPFWPADLPARAQIDKWAEWAKVTVAARFMVPIFWQLVRVPPSQRDPVAIERAVAAFEQTLDIAEAQLSRDAFLAGGDLTLADIQFGHLLYRYFDLPIARRPHPAVERYYAALTDRPAYREHVMIPYEELRVVDG